MSLFKEGVMRKPDKPSLLKVLMSEESLVSTEENCSYTDTIVDGGALLHRIRWNKGTKFEDIFCTYSRYLLKNYSNPTVIFDGYKKFTTKDQEHIRRNAIPQSSFIAINNNNEVSYTQQRYFSLTENKIEFIKFLSKHFNDLGIKVINCYTDADSTIVKVALKFAHIRTSRTLVVADDTDIAIMLLYHWKKDMEDIHLLQTCSNRIWSIKTSQLIIQDIKKHLLFIHSWSGCDTTSAIFGKGKGTIVKIMRKSSMLQHASTVITNPRSNQTEVGAASSSAFKILYGGAIQQSLGKTR